MNQLLNKFFGRREPSGSGKDIDLQKVDFDLEPFAKIEVLCQKHYGENLGCALSEHWQVSFAKDLENLKRNKKMASLNWVGDGFPATTKLRSGFPDFFNFHSGFENWATLDIQTGLHQFYSLDYFLRLKNMPLSEMPEIRILEIGGGYGRLALFFLKLFGKKCRYINVDFVPTSLAAAPQVIRSFFPDLKIADALDLETANIPLADFNYISLPAWRVAQIPKDHFSVGINIHSFQEMPPLALKFYGQLFSESLIKGGILYFVNNPPDSWTAHGVERYRPHSFYGLEEMGFREQFSQVNRFTADWEKICGIPSLERILQK